MRKLSRWVAEHQPENDITDTRIPRLSQDLRELAFGRTTFYIGFSRIVWQEITGLFVYVTCKMFLSTTPSSGVF